MDTHNDSDTDSPMSNHHDIVKLCPASITASPSSPASADTIPLYWNISLHTSHSLSHSLHHNDIDSNTNDIDMHHVLTLTESKYIELYDLLPNTSYELRLSYLGTIPYQFIFQYDLPSLSSLLHTTPTHHRKLLDTEKLIIHTDDNANIHNSSNMILLTATYNGVHPLDQQPLTVFTSYLTLEQLQYNAIPPIVLPLLMYAMIPLLCVTMYFVLPTLKVFIIDSVKDSTLYDDGSESNGSDNGEKFHGQRTNTTSGSSIITDESSSTTTLKRRQSSLKQRRNKQ